MAVSSRLLIYRSYCSCSFPASFLGGRAWQGRYSGWRRSYSRPSAASPRIRRSWRGFTSDRIGSARHRGISPGPRKARRGRASQLGYLIRERALLDPRCLWALAGLVASPSIGDSLPSDNVINRSISHRPAGPGGVSALCTTFIGYSPASQSRRDNRTSLPASMSARTTGSGIEPQPIPPTISLCFAFKSPTRQVLRLTTPKSRPSPTGCSDRTSWTKSRARG